jgi:ankyrin repeat protein
MILKKNQSLVDEEDGNGFTPLLLSAVYNKMKNIQILLAAGANLHHTDHDGDTILHFAIDKNNIECAQLLLDLGININIQDKHGWTPLQFEEKII